MIDVSKLPNIALIDTGILIRAVGERPGDPDAEACREFFEEMIRERKEVLVAAPSIAEYLRFCSGEMPARLRRLKHITIVSFDDRAAVLMAKEFPQEVFLEIQKTTDLPINYIKYDALIVACAKISKADCLVTLDGQRTAGKSGMLKLSEKVGLKAFVPKDFQSSQVPLPLHGPPSF